MQLLTANRANHILYNFLKSNNISGTFLVPVNICESVVNTLQYAGIDICFVDIADDLCIDRSFVLKNASAVSGVICVHTYGCVCDFSEFYASIKSVNPSLVIIDDCCLCVPEENQMSRLCADLQLFSTGSKKVVNAQGGGFAYCLDKWAYRDQNDKFGFFNNDLYIYDWESFTELKRDSLEHKRVLNKIYHTLLPQYIQLPYDYQQWRFNIWVDNKESILQSIFNAGLFASSHYQPLQLGFPNAEKCASRIINLFNDHFYTQEQAVETCKIINLTL